MCVEKCWQAISKFSPRVVHNCLKMSFTINDEMTALKLMYIITMFDDDDSDNNNENYIKSDHDVQQSSDLPAIP